ncbi:MAG: HAMP domain-containing sensor histidine kinase [Patulibacter sp.]
MGLRWSLRVRWTASFVVVTLIAIGAIALQVLPSLESTMVQQRLRALTEQTRSAVDDAAVRSQVAERAAGVREGRAAARERQTAADQRLVNTVARQTGATVALLGPRGDGRLAVRAETAGAAPDAKDVGLAERALTVGGLLSEAHGRGEAALRIRIAWPLASGPGQVLVATVPLSDVRRTVVLVRRRVLIGGALGVLVALIAGAVVAFTLSSRLRRLELGSREVAEGRFTTRFQVDAQDELGALARSLDTMQRQLEQLDSSRKRFIATASHELRTPLQSLSGYVELLRDEDLDEETRRSFFAQLEDQTNRLMRLCGDLLDLSRFESGGAELRSENTDLHALAARVAREFEPIVERERRSLSVQLVGAPVVHACDPDRVAQLLRTLIDNALKHSNAGDRVEVRVERRHGAAEISVTDSGPGVPPEELPSIFEPFHGASDGSGAGLGLAIAREISHKMRGELTVDSRPGRTTFTLRLPV